MKEYDKLTKWDMNNSNSMDNSNSMKRIWSAASKAPCLETESYKVSISSGKNSIGVIAIIMSVFIGIICFGAAVFSLYSFEQGYNYSQSKLPRKYKYLAAVFPCDLTKFIDPSNVQLMSTRVSLKKKD